MLIRGRKDKDGKLCSQAFKGYSFKELHFQTSTITYLSTSILDKLSHFDIKKYKEVAFEVLFVLGFP